MATKYTVLLGTDQLRKVIAECNSKNVALLVIKQHVEMLMEEDAFELTEVPCELLGYEKYAFSYDEYYYYIQKEEIDD